MDVDETGKVQVTRTKPILDEYNVTFGAQTLLDKGECGGGGMCLGSHDQIADFGGWVQASGVREQQRLHVEASGLVVMIATDGARDFLACFLPFRHKTWSVE